MMISRLDGIAVTVPASPISDFTIGGVCASGLAASARPTEGLLPSPQADQGGTFFLI